MLFAEIGVVFEHFHNKLSYIYDSTMLIQSRPTYLVRIWTKILVYKDNGLNARARFTNVRKRNISEQ